MTRNAMSVRVLLYINHYEVGWKDLSLRELQAIVREIQKIWPPDMRTRAWFDVEKNERFVNGRWETMTQLVCYHMPDKSQCAEIPSVYVHELVGKKFRIFPILDPQDDDDIREPAHRFRRIEMQLVEIIFVLE